MKKYITWSILFILLVQEISAQSKFGIEYKISGVRTENKGQILGGGGGFFGFHVTKEANQISSGFSLGIIYKLNARNLLKLHFGRHQNGRILDMNTIDDTGSTNSYTAIDERYTYSQLATSYLLRLVNKKIIIPVEIGININKNLYVGDAFVSINDFNFDYEVSTGIQYRLMNNFILGLHGIYTESLNEYQDKESVWGTYKPRQYGLELSMLYEFGKIKFPDSN